MPTCREKLIKVLGASEQTSCFDSRTVAEEKKKKFRIENKSRKTICRVQVDGCLINDHTIKKCDFLFKICELERYLLVELKGSNVEEGFAQLISTFRYLKNKLGVESKHFEGFIVSTQVPRAANLKVRNLKEQFLKKHQLLVQVTSRQHHLNI